MTSPVAAFLQQFPWPTPRGENSMPVWTGNGFQCGASPRQVLVYNEETTGWSEDLTQQQELEAGSGEHGIDRASRQLALDTVRKWQLGRQAVVLEVGSSSGFMLRDLQNQFPDICLVGADLQGESLWRLASKLPTVPLLQFNLCECPLPSNSVDCVIALNVLEHVADDRRALTQIARILKPGGLAHIEVPACPSCYDIYDEQYMHQRRYRMRDLRSLAKHLGFDIVRTTHLGVLVFPAFYLQKKRNQRLLTLPAAEKARIVRSQIRATRESRLLNWLIKAELILGRWLTFPIGIRCLVVLRKRGSA